MFFEFFALISSLIVLGKSADLVVDHVSNLSKFFKISSLAIGFLLVALMTSLPEFTISVISSTSHEGEIAAGNVFGSNIANILLILGLGSLIHGIKLSNEDKHEIKIILFSTFSLTLLILLATHFLNYHLSFLSGLLLLLIFFSYCFYSLKKKPSSQESTQENPLSKKDAIISFGFFFVGIFLVLLTSSFVVQFSIYLAKSANLSESFIGSTFVALGTSLPELSTALAALRKKEYSLALGDSIGSNLVNLTLVLGSASTINPISILILPIFLAILVFALLSDILLFTFSSFLNYFGKVVGAVFLICYLLYLFLIFNFQFISL